VQSYLLRVNTEIMVSVDARGKILNIINLHLIFTSFALKLVFVYFEFIEFKCYMRVSCIHFSLF
jgi:hypothetical protein